MTVESDDCIAANIWLLMRCDKIDIWPPYNILIIILVFALPFIAAALLDSDSGVKVFMLMFGSS